MKTCNSVTLELVKLEVSAQCEEDVFNTMNKKYKDIRLMIVTPIKGEINKFSVLIKVPNEKVSLIPEKKGFWSFIKKLKRSEAFGL